MITYKDLKSFAYINEIIAYVQYLLNIRFKRYGKNSYSVFCSFHMDTKDSFRVYVNDKEEVPIPEQQEEPDEPLNLSEPEELNPEMIDTLDRAFEFYQSLLTSEGRQFIAIRKCLDTQTLGTNLSDEAGIILSLLGVEKFIVAFDRDNAGRSAIKKISDKIVCEVFYLGSLQHDQDPADKLQDKVN